MKFFIFSTYRKINYYIIIIGYMYYCEYAHLLKKCTEHTCTSAIYYDQSSDIKADKCKTIVTFDTLLESKILDAGDILILSNLQKPWKIVCKDVNRTFDLEYSTYHILNRSELCECSMTAGNYLLYQAASYCEGTPEVKDGFFTTYYAFNQIVLDVLTEKFDTQVDENTITQSMLLHSDIPGYDLPAINFVSPSEEAQESHLLEEQDAMIYTHLGKVLIHIIDEQNAQIFKSHNDYVQNKRKFLQYLKYAETWQSTSVICSYAVFLCDILLIVTFIAFFLKYCKTMQAMLAAFITMSMSGIPPSKANPISRTFPPLFMINLSEEDQIIKDLEDIEGMQTTIQVISFFVCVTVAIIILYQIFKRCCYTHSMVKYCFPFFLISRILRGTCRMDSFVEVTNLMKGNTIWAHYTLTGYYPTSIKLSQQIPKENIHITTSWCCFKTVHIDWDNTMVTGISGIKIVMLKYQFSLIMISTHINDDHFKINLVARLLNQIYIVPVLPPGYDYDNLHANVMDEPTPSTSTGATASAPLFLYTA